MNRSSAGNPSGFKFFRVLLPDFTHRLPLPREFIKYFIQENNTWATLLSPLGKSWHVKVNGDNGILSFGDGWEKFAEDHKLTLGDFLVFKHKGSFIFDVTIFDSTTCERDYMFGLANRGTNDKVCPRPEETQGRKEINNSVKEDLEGSGGQEASSCGKRAAEPLEPVFSSEHHLSSGTEELKEQMRDSKTPDQMMRATRASRFEVAVRPYHLRYLEIPSAFRASNELSSICRLFLKDPKGRVWSTEVKHRLQGSRIRSQICEGWRNFSVANGLEDGDVCVFELKEKNVLHVQVRKRVYPRTHRGEDLRYLKVPQVECSQRRPKLTNPPTHCQPAVVGIVPDRKPLSSTPCLCFVSKIIPSVLARGSLVSNSGCSFSCIIGRPQSFAVSLHPLSGPAMETENPQNVSPITGQFLCCAPNHACRFTVSAVACEHLPLEVEFSREGSTWLRVASILQLQQRRSWRCVSLHPHIQRERLCLPCRCNQAVAAALLPGSLAILILQPWLVKAQCGSWR